MKFQITSILLGIALTAQTTTASFSRHIHRHAHVKSEIQKRGFQKSDMSAAALSQFSNAGIILGSNLRNNAAITITGLPKINKDSHGINIAPKGFFFQFINEASEDITVVVWSPKAGEDQYISQEVNVQQPDITFTVKPGKWLMVNIDASQGNNGQVNGAFSMIHKSNNSPLSSGMGSINNTWGEFNVAKAFSTFDVSRLPNMSGSDLVMKSFSAYNAEKAACVSNMENVTYVCNNPDHNSCWEYKDVSLINCPTGTANTTCNEQANQGGCAGWTSSTGFLKVHMS